MKRNHTGTAIACVTIAAAVVLLALSAQVPVNATEGDTNFTNVVTSGDITVGDDLGVGDDLDVTGDAELDGGLTVDDTAFIVANSTGNTTIAGTLGVTGASTLGGLLTVNDAALIDGDSDEVQIRAQGYTTQTNAILVVEGSDATDILAVSQAPAAGSGGDLIDLTDTFGIADGSDAMIGLDVNLTGANHTGAGNTLVGIDLDLTTADGQATESAISIADTDWDYGIESILDLENLLLPSVASSSVITTSDGALWTLGASEVWYIDRVFCNVTTNFDCTGDDCTIEIGLTGGDIDGFLDLDDAELQTTDAEIAGLTAGWQGFGSTDTRGAFFAVGGGVILGNDTIDIKIEDNSDQSNPTAGAATCYIVYTRLQ